MLESWTSPPNGWFRSSIRNNAPATNDRASEEASQVRQAPRAWPSPRRDRLAHSPAESATETALASAKTFRATIPAKGGDTGSDRRVTADA